MNISYQKFQKFRDWIVKERSIASYCLQKHLREYGSNVGRSSLILDIGCGSAPYKRFFEFDNYIALDTTRDGEVDIIGDTCYLPFRGDVADVVICTEVLEHVLGTERAIKELNRVLKKDGHLVLSTPLLIGKHGQVDYFRFTELALAHFLKEYGFEVLQLKSRGGIFSSLGLILAHVPGQVLGTGRGGKQGNKPGRWLFLLLSVIYIPLARLLFLLDHLDKKRDFTLGYELYCIKRKGLIND